VEVYDLGLWREAPVGLPVESRPDAHFELVLVEFVVGALSKREDGGLFIVFVLVLLSVFAVGLPVESRPDAHFEFVLIICCRRPKQKGGWRFIYRIGISLLLVFAVGLPIKAWPDAHFELVLVKLVVGALNRRSKRVHLSYSY